LPFCVANGFSAQLRTDTRRGSAETRFLSAALPLFQSMLCLAANSWYMALA
jgi:hypothetical protein